MKKIIRRSNLPQRLTLLLSFEKNFRFLAHIERAGIGDGFLCYRIPAMAALNRSILWRDSLANSETNRGGIFEFYRSHQDFPDFLNGCVKFLINRIQTDYQTKR